MASCCSQGFYLQVLSIIMTTCYEGILQGGHRRRNASSAKTSYQISMKKLGHYKICDSYYVGQLERYVQLYSSIEFVWEHYNCYYQPERERGPCLSRKCGSTGELPAPSPLSGNWTQADRHRVGTHAACVRELGRERDRPVLVSP